ncbi:integrase core domain-containing protein, partial [Escherichia coli]|uniref:integrase core domain-containing protein n=1 Tax=Escherichia coli TaxID=562 RepID=UPI002035B1E7
TGHPPKGRDILREAPEMKYVFIENHRAEFSIKAMCRVLRVARSGWYVWLRRRHQMSLRQQFRLTCDAAVHKAFAKPRRPKHYRPVKTGELIGMDAIELRMGEMRRYIITMIDEHSDYALALAVPSLNSDIVSHFFSRAARRFPVGISQIITDNGKEFLESFDKTLQEATIKHLWTYPYTPKMNAICERFNRTLREQFIEFNKILLFEDLALFNQKLAEYLVLYNSKRPHKALALMTPVEYILKENKNCNMWWTHTWYLQSHRMCAKLLSFPIGPPLISCAVARMQGVLTNQKGVYSKLKVFRLPSLAGRLGTIKVLASTLGLC